MYAYVCVFCVGACMSVCRGKDKGARDSGCGETNRIDFLKEKVGGGREKGKGSDRE